MGSDRSGPFTIRPARIDELGILADIEVDTFYALRDAGGVSGEAEATPIEKLAMVHADGLLIAAANTDDVPVGFLAALETGDELYIGEVDVLRSFQRQGIGKRLVLEAVAETARRGLRRTTLTTDLLVPFNARFYASLGFVRLDDHELSDDLRANLERQIASGLDPARRIAMALCN